MLTVSGRTNLRISKGDFLDVIFDLSGYLISLEDTVVFSVKKDFSDEDFLIKKEYSGIEGSSIRVQVNSSDMNTLDYGLYWYDLIVLKPTGEKISLMFPSKLSVERVVYNVGR